MSRATQIILAALAAGLWMNAAAMLLRPSPAQAQVGGDFSLSQISQVMQAIGNGTCANHKLCGP